VLALMQWFPTKAKADERNIALDKDANIEISGAVIIGVAPTVICHNTFTQDAFDLPGAIVPFADEACSYRESRRPRDAPEPGATACGGAQVKLRTEVTQERQGLAMRTDARPRIQI